jgi:dTMP kinase
MKGKFVMIDGIDGAGKGTITSALRKYEELKAKKILDLREYWQEHDTIPSIDEIKEYDVLISYEPTSCWIGKAIRQEIIKKNDRRKYSGMSTAQAFALDREILYKKLIVPALEAGKIIFQERGVISSLIYQPVQLEQITLMDLMKLPGNSFAIKHAPSLLIIIDIDPDIAIKRLKERKKQDDAIFEEVLFLRKIAARYKSDWVKKVFEQGGTQIEYLDTNPPMTVEDTEKKAVEIWEKFNNQNTLLKHV